VGVSVGGWVCVCVHWYQLALFAFLGCLSWSLIVYLFCFRLCLSLLISISALFVCWVGLVWLGI